MPVRIRTSFHYVHRLAALTLAASMLAAPVTAPTVAAQSGNTIKIGVIAID